MSKSIRFKAQGSSSVLGNFGPGDIARNIPDAMADHFVREAMCAEYLDASPAAPAADAAPEPATPAKPGRKAKASKD